MSFDGKTPWQEARDSTMMLGGVMIYCCLVILVVIIALGWYFWG